MITATGYSNGDDCFIAWSMPWTKDARGFEIRRDLIRADGSHASVVLDNYVGFAADHPQPHEHRPSTKWPFQRYTWTDHGVAEGDSVTYTIAPMLTTAAGALARDAASAVTVGPLTATSRATADIDAYFNRGILLSQFMTRRLPPDFTTKDLTKLKKALAKDDDELRTFLKGQLGDRLAHLLDTANGKGWHAYAALYELDDDELIGKLAAFGPRAHVVLSNGSVKAVGADGNAGAVGRLQAASVDLKRRMLWSEGLGHNKFLVLARTPGDPVAVWTGSTNWATTGLCTQMNNALLVRNATLARIYRDQWQRLHDDERTLPNGKVRHFGPALMAANDSPTSGGGPVSGRWTTWFTRTSAKQDLAAATAVINGATEAVLFLMFEPGSAGLRQVVEARLTPGSPSYLAGLYVHGVVNTLSPGGRKVSVTTTSQGVDKTFGLRVVEPQGVARTDLASWAAEVTRQDFIIGQGGVIGHAIIHSKVIVVDPFSAPVVITGSHNFSEPASTKNDENLLIIRGNRPLAERYAVNIMGTYQHYRWRAYLQDCAAKGVSPWQNLQPSDDWQKKHAEHDQELSFWVRP